MPKKSKTLYEKMRRHEAYLSGICALIDPDGAPDQQITIDREALWRLIKPATKQAGEILGELSETEEGGAQ